MDEELRKTIESIDWLGIDPSDAMELNAMVNHVELAIGARTLEKSRLYTIAYSFFVVVVFSIIFKISVIALLCILGSLSIAVVYAIIRLSGATCAYNLNRTNIIDLVKLLPDNDEFTSGDN